MKRSEMAVVYVAKADVDQNAHVKDVPVMSTFCMQTIDWVCQSCYSRANFEELKSQIGNSLN